jgi:uncharacterized protein YggE
LHGILLTVLLMSVQQPGPPLAAQPPPALVVTGNARILVTPDEATVRLGIVRQAATAQAAQDQANAAAQEILSAIQKAGISESGVSVVDRFEPAMAGGPWQLQPPKRLYLRARSKCARASRSGIE